MALQTVVHANLPWIPQAIYAAAFPPRVEWIQNTSLAIAYQSLLAQLKTLSWENPHAKCFVLSSTSQESSPSWVMMYLGFLLASAGKTVLLIDADFRSPSLHLAFDIAFDKGLQLCTVIQQLDQAKPLAVDSAFAFEHVPGIPGLFLLPNAMAHRTRDTIALEHAGQVFDAAKPYFDWILVDSAPLLTSPDTALVAQQSDGLVILQERDTSPLQWASVQTLVKENGLPLVGVIERQGFYSQIEALPSV